MKLSYLRPVVRLFGHLLVMLAFTLLLLEIVTRLIWGGGSTAFILGRPAIILPLPLVTGPQKDILDDWSGRAETYLRFDSVLGWSINPDANVELDGILYSSNSIGIRSLREYDLAKPEGVIRIAAFGPSFTFSQDVPNQAAWPVLVEQARPDLEVMNWGVGGYGTDQSFLRYLTQGAAYQPDIVLIGYEEDNLLRNVNRFRPYYLRHTIIPLTKPVYRLEPEGLVLLPNPFADFDEFYATLLDEPNRFLDATCPGDSFCNEALYRPRALDRLAGFRLLRAVSFNLNAGPLSNGPPLPRIDPQETSARLMETFITEVIRNQATPVVILFPQQPKTVANFETGRPGDYHQIIPVVKKMGVELIDMTGILVEEKRSQKLQYRDFFGEASHFNERGNALVARAVLEHLCREKIITNC